MSAAIAHWLHCQAHAVPCALVTILAVHGRAPRRVGTQMAVSFEDAIGSFSGGCLDAAVVDAARTALLAGAPRAIRFGAGSEVMDIQLPCGSGLDLQIDPIAPSAAVQAIAEAYQCRQCYVLSWPDRTQSLVCTDAMPKEKYAVRFVPDLRLVLAGRGDTLILMTQLARISGLPVVALCPDLQSLRILENSGATLIHLATHAKLPKLSLDQYSAALTLFHDHEWELTFLQQALDSQALVIAAMGSHHAHDLRCSALRDLGVTPLQLAKLRGPFGLLHRARLPHELAISMLAELLQIYRDQYFPEPIGVEHVVTPNAL